MIAKLRRGGDWRLLCADRKNAGGVAALVEDTDNFGAVIGYAIEDRVWMNRHAVYAAHQFGALPPRMGVLDNQMHRGVDVHHKSVRDFR